ncbi:MAG: hypothetical protein D6698_16645 [Gammaproteobacteria bacterium]|nr:MAG: hypothetical protein D6698_16645 [Gammaproteobacteria bacterium]
MNKKRKPKAWQALRRRVLDIYAAVLAPDYDWEDIQDGNVILTPAQLEHLIEALKVILGTPRRNWTGWSRLAKFDNVDSATDYLYSRGFRASRRLEPSGNDE